MPNSFGPGNRIPKPRENWPDTPKFAGKSWEQRQRRARQLGSLLKVYFPLMMALFPGKPPLMMAVIKRWASLEKLKRAHPKTLRTFLKENGMRNQDTQTEL